MNEKKIEELAFRVVGDMGGSFTMALGYIGDRLGIFAAMADVGPLTSTELAEKTGLNERYVREWAIEKIGQGGMGEVYLAEDIRLDTSISHLVSKDLAGGRK